jgi:glycosyltransferase involved in cell wall biosynthesis
MAVGAGERIAKGVRVSLLAPEMASRGGVQSFMWRIWQCLVELAVDPSCLSMAVLNDATRSLRDSGLVPMAASVVGGRRSKLGFVLSVLRQSPVDAMIVGHIGQAPLALLLKKLGRVRNYAVVLHGVEAWMRVSLLKRWACREAFCVIATTRFTAQQFVECNALPALSLRVFPLCADESPRAASTFSLSGNFRILIVGRQLRSEGLKGFDQLIRALALMHASGRRATLHIIGEGDEQPLLRDIARDRGVASYAVFHGAVTDADLAAAYQSCDVYAMPSNQEGFGIAFVEAMLHAKPCVGARAGGIPEVIEDGVTGFLVPYGHEQSLADAICRLYDDVELRHDLGRAGLERARRIFSYAAFRSNYQEMLSAMLAAR